ncbi:hypothetical protein B9T26_09200 [Acinetobacter sp. ANC 4169]|uniref:hypothetical protein n=1 Tax=Acinetobacter sp. ANC 4169 TaxID=1977879 RepID=UPI000A347882|nr:hypothetical protein [Acinetobacter sp. ANC 4169]OTG73253.1 hypothetical protein B9T26_09200 [Acinetobacter sp. ANC 4169]
MKKTIFILVTCITLASCDKTDLGNSIQYEFPECGTSQLNGKTIPKVCATRDLIATKTHNDYTPKFIKIIVGAGHAGYGSSTSKTGAVLGFENKEFDMQGHAWDFSKQKNPSLVLSGHDIIVRNGIILNANILLGSNIYFSPNFSTKKQINNLNIEQDGFLYANNTYDCKKLGISSCDERNLLENVLIENIKNKANDLTLQSWGGGILNSQLILKNRINIYGSKATIINNKIISDAELKAENSIFPLIQINKSIFLAYSQQIFPDENDDKIAIPSTLYIKFSPDTVIDGNTFTLTQKNDQAYAIVLDHSPRVRITNNTFNGFKVPILMDQWSSIVDEKGNEIKPENFTGYGNVINPDKFAGNVTMNRKGEIVKE